MSSNMLQLKTSEQLMAALAKAAAKKLTPQEVLEQRVSFVFGSIKPDNGVTRERIKQVIIEQDGGAMECACDSI